jgi:hypothetical protein
LQRGDIVKRIDDAAGPAKARGPDKTKARMAPQAETVAENSK